MKSSLSSISFVALSLGLALSSVAQAAPNSIDWPTRNSKVICGGTVDGTELNIRIVTPGELMGAESENSRILVYMDLHKPGQLHLAISDSLTDEEYDKRQAILKQLSPEDAALFQKITMTRVMEFYVGFTEGVADLRLSYANRVMSLSCQEVKN